MIHRDRFEELDREKYEDLMESFETIRESQEKIEMFDQQLEQYQQEIDALMDSFNVNHLTLFRFS